jgi:hypothetical protein
MQEENQGACRKEIQEHAERKSRNIQEGNGGACKKEMEDGGTLREEI